MNNWISAPQKNHLADNDVHVWAFHLDISTARSQQFYPLLSAREKQRSERFVDFTHRQRFIASHGFMRLALSSYLNVPADALVFKQEARGKPVLDQAGDTHPVHFNLSHSQQLALLAISKNRPVGVDVEYIKRKNAWQKISKRFFTPEEQQALFSLPDTQQAEAFFQLWTRKEAHMKVTGEGLHLSPSEFIVSVPPQPPAFIRYTQKNDLNRWYMKEISLQEIFTDYQACLSVEGDACRLQQFIFK